MKTLRVTLADIIGPTGTPNSTATVHARYVDTSGRGRDVHLTDGTIVVPVRRVAAPDGDPEVFDFDVYANDVAPVREVDYGHLVEVSWTVVAPTGAKTSGVRRVAITDDMPSVVQLGLLSTPTPVPPYTGGYVLPGELDALDDRVVVLEAGGGGVAFIDNGDGTLTILGATAATTTTTTTAATTTTTTTAATTTTTTTAGGLSAAVMALSPLGYWKLDETSGTTATDSSGNARHGAYVGSVVLNVAGSGFPDFPKSPSSYVEVPDDAAFSLDAAPGITVFALTYLTTLDTSPRSITRKGNASGNYEHNFLKTTTNVTQWSTWNTAGTPLNFRIGAAAMSISTWHAAVGSITDGAGTGGTGITLYVDSGTPTSGSVGGSGAGYANGTAPLRIGETWAGSLGHVAIFPGVLTAGQVSGLIDAARTEGLIP